MFQKMMYSLIFISILFSNYILISTAQAEIEIYEGRGEYLRTDETIEYSKKQAKIEAERDIIRQAYFHVTGISQSSDSVLDYDEVFGESEGIIRILDVKYKLIPEKENYIIRAIIKAEVDTEELNRVLKDNEE